MELMDIDRGTFSFVDLDNFALDHLAFSSAAFFAFSALSAAFYELFVELSSIFLPLLSFSFSLFLVSTIAFLLLFQLLFFDYVQTFLARKYSCCYDNTSC